MKDLITDIEPLMAEGYGAYTMAVMLGADVELVLQAMAYIDEQHYLEDMVRDPYRTVS